ncbi:unnamed protein product [Caenorhabditis auriculariae]|uniref:Uncharacterized protein n=1 Tax=Caenorhabditis auriculariae TaxID=2777116 RepID=A0A8S1GRK5_9PELO|nr:unnamed protein product [Caenorhabditis auriculariae]
MTKVSIQNAGMKMFGRTEAKVEATRFRLSQEGVRYLFPFMSKKKIMISKDDMLHMLKCEQPLVQLEDLACKEEIRKNSSGSLVVYCNEEDPVCCWVGYHTIAPYVSKEERLHHLRMLGVDCSEIEQLMKSKRKEKDRDAAWAAKEPKKETAPDGLPDVKMESAGEEEEDVKEEIGI